MPPPTERCETCKFWVRENGRGQCHRHAPAPLVQCANETRYEHNESDPVYPRTPSFEWCGEYAKSA